MSALDIEPFLMALFEPYEYTRLYPECNVNRADVNGDGTVTAFDVEPFLELLFP